MPKTDATKSALIRAAITVWEELDEKVLNKLAGSMNRRLQALLKPAVGMQNTDVF